MRTDEKRSLNRAELHALVWEVAKAGGATPVAVIASCADTEPHALLELGARGVRAYVNLTLRDGWDSLRHIVAEPGARTSRLILEAIHQEVGCMSTDLREFFQVLVQAAPPTTTVRHLSTQLKIQPSTLVSRFVRASLPSPKRYLVAVRLLFPSSYFVGEGVTVGLVAYRLHFASPQSLGRHLR